MEDEYGMSDLSSRQFIVGDRPPPAISHPPPPHRSFLTTDNLPYYMLNFTGSRAEAHGGGRWPRQETLTLLEIRSRLDPKFKEANQKGPLWDELSRIMCEESGYQRSGKKCREKFENLYKYYKKTKTAGRQDGKHYRFFRQLEALYGDTTTNNNNNNNSSSSNQDFISISNSSDFDNFISSDEEEDTKTGRSLKEKIKESIEMQMKEMMEKQDAWMETMMKKIEANEQESISREEQRRREDFERIEREQRMWAREKAWIQARDEALMDAFMKMAGTKKEEANLVYSTSTRPEEAELMDVGFGIDIISSTMSRQHVHHHHQQQNDGHASISEQGIDHGSSPPDYNAMADVGGFRYFGGESYGGL